MFRSTIFKGVYIEKTHEMEVEKFYSDTAEQWVLYYLSVAYGSVKFHDFALQSLHRFYNTYQPPAGGAKVLNFGGGPVVCHLISAAPKCKEVVFAEFTDDCREQVNLWLKKDPSAFDWRPFFSYVVRTLEGGTEKDIVEREETLRSILKSVIPCDIFKPQPLDDIGPYDIIFTSYCLDSVCPSNDSYRESVSKLARLLKPGGTFLMHGAENCHYFKLDGKKVKTNPVSRELTCKSLESAGLSLITMDTLPIASVSAEMKKVTDGADSILCVAATKRAA